MVSLRAEIISRKTFLSYPLNLTVNPIYPQRVMEIKRIQRKRTRGWRMPPSTVYVGRPTKYGNPFKVKRNDGLIFREAAIRMYERHLRNELIKDPHFLDELKGKDLACWCPLDKPCHADVILKILGEKA